MPNPGKQFEATIRDFYRKIDPLADVIFDHRVKDIDTGTMRQVDGWITLRIPPLNAINVLISCKDHTKRLDIGEIETFSAEMRSVGANAGALFSSSGFYEPAKAKGRKLNISCCQYFDNQPPEMPADWLIQVYLAQGQFVLFINPIDKPIPVSLYWHEILCKPATDGLAGKIADQLQRLSVEMHDPALVPGWAQSPFVPIATDKERDIFVKRTARHPDLRLSLALQWKWMRGGLDVTRLTGAVNHSNDDFVGKLVSSIPVTHAPEGEEWTPCERPTEEELRLRFTVSPLGETPASCIFENLGNYKLIERRGTVFQPPQSLEAVKSMSSIRGTLPGFDAGSQISITAVVEGLRNPST